MFSINNQDDAQSQLQYLINQIPHLHSLSFSSDTLFISLMPVYEFINVSIHRLDLRGYDQYFNDEQCKILSRSLLGIQCEILFIKIKNRCILIDLISNMINLRTLNIQCEDDKFHQNKTR